MIYTSIIWRYVYNIATYERSQNILPTQKKHHITDISLNLIPSLLSLKSA